MKHFIKKYKSEIALGICALTAGAMSFFITLNLASKLGDSQGNYDVSQSQNIIAKKLDNKLSGEIIKLDDGQKLSDKSEVIIKEQDTKELVLFEEKTENKDKNKTENALKNNDDYGISENTPFEDVNEIFSSEVTVETASKNIEKEKNKICDFVLPTSGDIILAFAQDKLVYSETLEEWIVHEGIDIKNKIGTPVKASEDGVVESVKMDPRYGNTIILKHDDVYKTVYSNLSTLDKVYVGMNVKKGDIISSIGEGFGFECKEGPHVHFEIIENGVNISPDSRKKD